MGIRPSNVIWITTDHMRYDVLGANGHPSAFTPNLDRLFRNGVSFDNCFCQNPLCMPSRCSFMTGLYPPQTQVTNNGRDLRPDFSPTAPEVFRNAGFQTAQIGKLHFQSHEDCDLDPRPRHSYGFDVFWQAEEPGPYEDAYLKWLRGEHPGLVDLFRVPRSNSPHRIAGESCTVLNAPWQASFSGWVAEQTSRYLSGHFGQRTDNQFIHMGFYAPHPPLNPTADMFAPYKDIVIPAARIHDNEGDDKPEMLKRWLDQADPGRADEYRRHFLAMVTGVDFAVGQLVATLTQIGALEDTLIVFSADHGDMCGDHGIYGKGHHFYDEVMHLPLALHWPRGLGTAERRVKGLFEMVDLLPTLMGLCGLPAHPAMAGKSCSEALLENREPEGRESVFAYHDPGHVMVRTEAGKYIRFADGGEVLYDFADREAERVNHALDPACKKQLDHMRGLAMARILEATRSPGKPMYRY